MLEKIRAELDGFRAKPEQPTSVLVIHSANKWMESASKRPDPEYLFHKLIVTGEITFLFAASNVGKSILAVQIAEHIAQSRRVLYIDLELSEKQFQMRYTSKDGKPYCFPENFCRAEISIENLNLYSMREGIFKGIICEAELGTTVFIVDNMSFVCPNAENAENATLFVQELKKISKRYNATIIVIGHTAKMLQKVPLSQYHLSGSAKIANLFDAGFAIGVSAKDHRLRYIKQVKVRTGEVIYGEDNVLVCEITDKDGFLHFNFLTHDHEYNHLKIPEAQRELVEKIRVSVNEGASVNAVMKQFGLSHGTAYRYMQQAKKTNESK